MKLNNFEFQYLWDAAQEFQRQIAKIKIEIDYEKNQLIICYKPKRLTRVYKLNPLNYDYQSWIIDFKEALKKRQFLKRPE